MSEINTQANENETSPLIDLNGLARFKSNLDLDKNKNVNLSVVDGMVCITYTEE